ncbi:hypothetical protein GPECTOR_5g256 [Gonium pectorale]|uniref:Glycosyl transferase CAP10 domain-containing protein n=1 Tax=Gonium pectorale TaxID=33097 RepID=A0A150GWV5_GONPE|nr:hypothetical protein GPECTOR_5g256 [Gonium pectorale]|eukprot:KXZ54158.1 hypothetical protein GPECTOR_5g256 [Gonium pectorale]
MLANFRKFPFRSKGAGIAFKDGQPYLITDPAAINTTGHHRRLIVAHFALFSAMAATFGPAIPDVEFLFGTADQPTALLASYSNGTDPNRLPLVLRFCRSAYSHADVLVPDIHFFIRNFTGKLLSAAATFNATWPWEKKTNKLFGRFSPYPREVSKYAPELYRRGFEGKDICRDANPSMLFCDVRKHFMHEWARGARKVGLPVDVAQQPKRDMLYHASHKLLLHLDGQSCSSRLEQLLVLGSAVVKEESGGRGWAEARRAIRWAERHDSQAAAIGAAAQAVALRYLHKRALMCYWLRLLQEMAAIQRYKPGPEAGERNYTIWMPVSKFMQDEGMAELVLRKMTDMEFWD